MNQPTIKTAFRLILAVIITLGLSLTLQSVLAVWTNPACPPPGCNVPAPINIGSIAAPSGQLMYDGLSISNNSVIATSSGLGVAGNFIVNASSNDLFVDFTNNFGNVGIGTGNPQAKLSVGGDGDANSMASINGGAVKMYGLYVNGGTSVSIYGDNTFGSGVTGWSTNAAGVYGNTQSGYGVYGNNVGASGYGVFGNGPTGGFFQSSAAGPALVTGTGNVGIGVAIPGAKLDVNGTLKISGGNPGQGKVLMSDASGLASWVATSSLGISGGGLKQINEVRTRGGTWPGYNCATAGGDTCGNGTCGQPYRCTQADASVGRVCNDVWGYNGWDAIDTVNCGVSTVQWAGTNATTAWVCTANGAQGAYNSCTGY